MTASERTRVTVGIDGIDDPVVANAVDAKVHDPHPDAVFNFNLPQVV